MPMIDSALIKPASDAVQAAFNAWCDAGQHVHRVETDRPSDSVGIDRAKAAVSHARKRYEQALSALAKTTHEVIGRAELAKSAAER